MARSNPSDTLFHYTTPSGLHGIIRDKALWATDVRCLNDSSEFTYALSLAGDYLKDHRSEIVARSSETVWKDWVEAVGIATKARAFVASFCEDGDLLSQWRAYGQVSGYAIGFSYDATLRMALAQEDPSILLKCVYVRQEQLDIFSQAIATLLSEYPALGPSPTKEQGSFWGRQLFGFLLPYAACLKHPTFHEENEWRLIVRSRSPAQSAAPVHFRPTRRSLAAYLSVGFQHIALPDVFTDVVVGPTPHSPLSVELAEEFLRQAGYRAGLPRASRIPFRDW